jgi:oligoribonuclease
VSNTAKTAGSDAIVWIDCEMTGLDLSRDALVEIAVIVTDSELHALDPGLDLVIKPPAESLVDMNEVVVEMHTSSGLLDELDSGISLAQAEEQVLAYIRRFVPDSARAPLAGNSVGTDRGFLERDMPALTEFLHYRIIDVSSIKELARRWYPRAYFNAPKKAGGHRALADIAESIDELRYYRAVLFPDGSGPDSATSRKVAAMIASAPTVAAAPTTAT